MNEKASKMLLIVDNDPAQAKKVQDSAKRNADILDTEMTVVPSRIEAEKLIDAGVTFLLAVVDLRLEGELGDDEAPITPGLRVIEQLKAKHPDCIVIALTSHYSTSEGQEAILAGADDFVSTKWTAVKDWTALLGERLKMWKGAVSRPRRVLAKPF